MEEERYLRRSLRRIVLGRELDPRTPRWRVGWKRALFNYTQCLSQLSANPPQEE